MDQPYRIVHEMTVTKVLQFSVDGPGIGYDKPWFQERERAETLCRNFAQAYNAGKNARSEELLVLLESGRRR